MLSSRTLSERAAGTVALKAENLQRTGSFKLRGALAKLAALGDAVRLTVYLTDMAAFGPVNEVYESFFESDPPARVAIAVAALPRGALVEIDAVVALPA